MHTHSITDSLHTSTLTRNWCFDGLIRRLLSWHSKCSVVGVTQSHRFVLVCLFIFRPRQHELWHSATSTHGRVCQCLNIRRLCLNSEGLLRVRWFFSEETGRNVAELTIILSCVYIHVCLWVLIRWPIFQLEVLDFHFVFASLQESQEDLQWCSKASYCPRQVCWHQCSSLLRLLHFAMT